MCLRSLQMYSCPENLSVINMWHPYGQHGILVFRFTNGNAKSLSLKPSSTLLSFSTCNNLPAELEIDNSNDLFRCTPSGSFQSPCPTAFQKKAKCPLKTVISYFTNFFNCSLFYFPILSILRKMERTQRTTVFLLRPNVSYFFNWGHSLKEQLKTA